MIIKMPRCPKCDDPLEEFVDGNARFICGSIFTDGFNGDFDETKSCRPKQTLEQLRTRLKELEKDLNEQAS